jgi:hypothetical protein
MQAVGLQLTEIALRLSPEKPCLNLAFCRLVSLTSVDLMEALKRSIGGSGGAQREEACVSGEIPRPTDAELTAGFAPLLTARPYRPRACGAFYSRHWLVDRALQVGHVVAGYGDDPHPQHKAEQIAFEQRRTNSAKSPSSVSRHPLFDPQNPNSTLACSFKNLTRT